MKKKVKNIRNILELLACQNILKFCAFVLLLCSFAVVSTQDFFLFFMFNYEIMAHLPSKKYLTQMQMLTKLS